jgi:hypothetical protein
MQTPKFIPLNPRVFTHSHLVSISLTHLLASQHPLLGRVIPSYPFHHPPTTSIMFGPLFLALSALSLLAIFILKPIVQYFHDPKGLRKYPNLSPLSGITNLAFIWESNKGFRSAALLEAHKKSPVVRIGPNSLSYGDLKAIKVCRSFVLPVRVSGEELLIAISRIYTAMARNARRTSFIPPSRAPTSISRTSSTSLSMHGNERSFRPRTL